MTSEEGLITEEMKTMVGKELRSWTSGEASRSDIRRYTQAVMDDNPLYYDEAYAKKTRFGGVVAPGVFPVRYLPRQAGTPDLMRQASPNWDGGITSKSLETWVKLCPEDMHEFNAGSELEVFQHARPGDVISGRDVTVDVYEKTGRAGRMVFFVIESTYTNQKDEILCIDRQIHVMRRQLSSNKEA